MQTVMKRFLLSSLFFWISLSCQRPGKPKSQERKPVTWENFTSPQKSEAWSELLQCLESSNDLPIPPLRQSFERYRMMGVGVPILSLGRGMSLWMQGDAVTVMGKDGLRSVTVPCFPQKQFKGMSLCLRRLSIQDQSGRLRLVDLTRDGLLLEYKDAGIGHPMVSLAIAERGGAAPSRAARPDEIEEILRYLDIVFQHEPTTHHMLRNLKAETRFQSCLKAAKAYGKKGMFARVAKIQSQIKKFSSQRLKQIESVEFSANFFKRERGIEASLVIRNNSDKPFYLEPDPDYPCLVALSCAGHRPRVRSSMDSCEAGFASAVGVAPGHSVNIGLDQIYDLAEMDSTSLSRCPAVLGFHQPIRPGRH